MAKTPSNGFTKVYRIDTWWLPQVPGTPWAEIPLSEDTIGGPNGSGFIFTNVLTQIFKKCHFYIFLFWGTYYISN